MNKTTLGALLVLVLAVGLGSFVLRGSRTSEQKLINGEPVIATVYKSSSCGCCGVWASYMKNEGYAVEIRDVEDIIKVKERLGVPGELTSCHTTEIGGYVVEGHIPEEAIEKLLTERPDIKGIGMYGMPQGSPGMPGPKAGPFVIYEINRDGTKGEVFVTI